VDAGCGQLRAREARLEFVRREDKRAARAAGVSAVDR